jgi:hypothetical protein
MFEVINENILITTIPNIVKNYLFNYCRLKMSLSVFELLDWNIII